MRVTSLSCLLLVGCGAPLATVLPSPTPAPKLAVDLHAHFTMAQAAKPLFKGEPGHGTMAWVGCSRLRNQLEEQHLHAAGVHLALATVWPPFEFRLGRTALGEAINQLRELRQFGLRQPGFAVVSGVAQARTALARGRIALLPAVEGGEGIREVEDVDRLWVEGARSITVVHLTASGLGGAAQGQLAFAFLGCRTEQLDPRGLTELGRAAVQRMIDLGIVIDLAHASDALAADVLDLAEAQGVPVLNTHGGARELLRMERNISDPLAKRIAAGGGLVGVTAYKTMVADVPDAGRWPGFVPNTCDEVVAHWIHLAEAAGAQESIALGSDLNGFITRHAPGGSCPHGLRNSGDLPELWAALVARGVRPTSLDGSGERLLSIFEQADAKAKPERRAAALRLPRYDWNLFAVP